MAGDQGKREKGDWTERPTSRWRSAGENGEKSLGFGSLLAARARIYHPQLVPSHAFHRSLDRPAPPVLCPDPCTAPNALSHCHHFRPLPSLNQIGYAS